MERGRYKNNWRERWDKRKSKREGWEEKEKTNEAKEEAEVFFFSSSSDQQLQTSQICLENNHLISPLPLSS